MTQVGDKCVGVCNIMLNGGNNGMGSHNIIVDVRNNSMCVGDNRVCVGNKGMCIHNVMMNGRSVCVCANCNFGLGASS